MRKILKDPSADDEAKLQAQFALQRLPRNSAEVRYRNRCVVSGRSRGYYRKFGLSRIAFRELSLRGLVLALESQVGRRNIMLNDPISDMLSRIKNAINAGHDRVEFPASKNKGFNL